MRLTLEELKQQYILPILNSLTSPDATPKVVDAAADAIIKIIEQDRDAAEETPHD